MNGQTLRLLVSTLGISLAPAGVAIAQSPWEPTSRAIEIDAGDRLSLWLAVPSSTDADFGVRLLETALSEFLLGTLGGEVSTELSHSERGLLCGFTGPSELVLEVNARLDRWATSPEEDFFGDTVELLRDRTLLRADDESFVLPGERLRYRLGGRASLTRDDLLRLRSMDTSEVLDELRGALRRERTQRVAVGRAELLPFADRSGSAFPGADRFRGSDDQRTESFPRLNGVYHQIAFDWSAGNERERAIAALAMAALWHGVLTTFVPRGSEYDAAFRSLERPVLSDRLLIGRRGVDSAPVSDVVEELDRFIQGFPDSPEFEMGFGLSRASTLSRWAPEVPGVGTRFGLHQQARILAESEILGVPHPTSETVGEIERDDVRAFLRDRLSRPVARWSLIPEPR